MNFAEYSYTQTKVPSYLKAFHVSENEIILISGPHAPSESSLSSPDEIPTRLSLAEEEADLTGNPLKIDLGGNETFEIQNEIKPINNWSLEESRQVPVKLKLARRILNQLINQQKLPVYAICDGGQTVILGGQKLNNEKTCLINVLGYFPNTHEFTTLPYMEKDHKRISQTDKVDVLVEKKYFLHGTDLSKVDLRSCELNGSISIEAVWNVWGDYGVPKDAFMIVQTVIGHRISLIDMQWQELNLLQHFLNILSDVQVSSCEDTKICKSSKDILSDDDFERFISYLNQFIVNNVQSKDPNEPNTLCFENLRPETLMDKLWLLLKNCKNLSSLRDYLTYFFESLAEMEKNIYNLSENVSTVGTIIKGILDGKIAVPTINFSKALELLYELGVEKLKNDYLTILSKINHSVHESVGKKWSEFHQTNEMHNQKMRKTSIMLKLPSTNMSQNQKKLNYLRQLHAAAELMLQVEKNCVLSEGNLNCFREAIFNDYIMLPKNEDISDIKHLCEFRFKLKYTDLEMIKERTPVMWSVKMYSNCNHVEVTTIYHLSEYKIFPPNIFNNYNDYIDCPKDIQKYYITKFRSIVDSTFVHT